MDAEGLPRMLPGDLGGDMDAGPAFRSYERFLRRVVRRWLTPPLRRRFDSADVVQSVWAGLLRGGSAAGYGDVEDVNATLGTQFRKFQRGLRIHRAHVYN